VPRTTEPFPAPTSRITRTGAPTTATATTATATTAATTTAAATTTTSEVMQIHAHVVYESASLRRARTPGGAA